MLDKIKKWFEERLKHRWLIFIISALAYAIGAALTTLACVIIAIFIAAIIVTI